MAYMNGWLDETNLVPSDTDNDYEFSHFDCSNHSDMLKDLVLQGMISSTPRDEMKCQRYLRLSLKLKF